MNNDQISDKSLTGKRIKNHYYISKRGKPDTEEAITEQK